MQTLFSKSSDILYFNSANLSLCPNPILNAIDTYRRQFEINPTQSLKDSWRNLWGAQEKLAHFLGATPSDLILRTNVTDVLNAFILGVPLNPDEEILVGELEYGAIANICRFRSERDKLPLRFLKIPQSPPALSKLTSTQLIESITSQLTSKTRILVLSHVIAGLGLKMPIEDVAEVTRKMGIYFIVDGAYAPGALEVNFSTLQNIDFYGCSLYKWLLGPKGTAFGWVHPQVQEKLLPLQAGWTTFESQGDFNLFGAGSRFQQKFQLSGCRDFSPFFAINETIELWQSIEPSAVRKHILKLNQLFQSEIERQLHWRPLLPSDSSLVGPITVFRLPDKIQAQASNLSQYFLEKIKTQLHFTQLNSGWYGVFSPHIYNSEEEVQELVMRLKSLAL